MEKREHKTIADPKQSPSGPLIPDVDITAYSRGCGMLNILRHFRLVTYCCLPDVEKALFYSNLYANNVRRFAELFGKPSGYARTHSIKHCWVFGKIMLVSSREGTTIEVAEDVTWEEALAFLQWLVRLLGTELPPYRVELPATRAELEAATVRVTNPPAITDKHFSTLEASTNHGSNPTASP